MDRSPEVLRAAEQGDPVAMTRVMVATPSVNPRLEDHGSNESEMARITAEWLDSWGFRVRVTEVEPGRPNVVGTLGSEGPHLLLNGHLDTVGVAGMTVDPFGADSTGDRIVGRGSADMKSGLAAVLATARSMAADRPGGQLTVALTCDEEHASVGMQALVAEGVTADLAVVTEPTSLAVMPAHKGFSWVEVEVRGRAAHGSRPEVGVDAVRHAAAFLHELEALEAELRSASAHPLLGHGSFHAGTIRGGTAWSVYPDRCAVTLERRTLPAESGGAFLHEVEAALDRLRQRLPGLNATARQDLVRPPSDVSPDHPLVQGLLASLAEAGLPGRVEGMTAWVDAALLNEAGIPSVCFGPGSIGAAHTADESVPIREIVQAADVLTRFSRRALAGGS